MTAPKTRNRLQDSTSRIRVTDVAKLAGCAPATVSRALNNPDKVSREKRERVESAMRQLGYVRNHAARALRSQRSHMIGVLIPTLDYALYARMVGAATARFSEAGFSTLIATFGYDLDTEAAEARLLLERGADALVLVGQNHRPTLDAMLDQFGVPYVCTYTLRPDGVHPTVGFDNAEAAARLARHLIQLGHRRISVISGITKDNDRTSERLNGIKAEFTLRSIACGAGTIVERPYSISDGREACALLLSRGDLRPTAIICGNDVLAFGAIVECRSRGLRVPEDVSIVGFDNLDFSLHSNPPLTTIDVPTDEMGKAAANFIIAKLNSSQVARHSRIEVDLVLRGSSAPPDDV